MRSLSLILLVFSASAAQAQWGTGIYPGTSCNNPYAPAGQAVNGNDQLMNLSGQLAARNQKIAQLQQTEKDIDDRITRAKSDMGVVLTTAGINAIKEHRESDNSASTYSTSCTGTVGGHANSSASAGSTYADAELFSTAGSAHAPDPTVTQRRPPDVFCALNPATGQKEDLWDKFVEDDGTVNQAVCDYNIPGATKGRLPNMMQQCHDGLHDYYENMAEKDKLQKQIAQLDTEARGYERQLNRIHDQITEGTYCPQCAAQRAGYSNLGTQNSILQGAGIFLSLGLNLMNQRPAMGPMGYPPPMMPYGGPGYPVNPYAARLPGYNGIGPGQTYGAVPGGIGPGAFACQNTNPMGNTFGSPSIMPFMGGQASPFSNPYSNPLMASMFNPGAGPGWGFPQYGNGVPGLMGPFGNPMGNPFATPFGNQLGMNPMMMGMNPGMMGNQLGMNPYEMNTFGVNPYNPYASNPFMGTFGAYNPYGSYSPYGPGYPYSGGPMSPYGAGAPGMMPYMGYNPYGGGYPYGTPYGPGYGSNYGLGLSVGFGGGMPGGIPNYGFQNPWSAPLGSPVGSFFGQVNVLNNRIQTIQNGGYGSAPAVLPYLNSPSPVYNAPGGPLNLPPVVPPH